MSYKTIIVHLDCSKRRTERLDLALRFAEEFDAHLIGLFALDLYFGLPMAADAGAILVETELDRRDACMNEAKNEFFSKSARRAAKVEWRATEEDAASEVAAAARSADLIVIGQTDPDNFANDGVSAGFAADVVLKAGKPVLIVPYAGHFEGVGKRTMVAWNAAREAGRALTDALPVLERSGAVDVVSFEEGGDHPEVDEEARAALKIYLEDHGVNATISNYVNEELSPGELILSRASNDAADCIVMGAFGHSPMKETLLGGATRTVLRSMTVPVIMSH